MRVGLFLLAFLLAGCTTAQTIKVDRGAFALTYADLKAATVLLLRDLRIACQAKALPADRCEAVEGLAKELGRAELDVRRMIAHPEVEPDWERIGQMLQFVLGLALKVP